MTPAADFYGKIILLTNTLPQGKEVEAFLSRCLNYRISFNEREIKQMLRLAADSPEYFEDRALSKDVADFISERADADFSQVNLRTLRLGYELAKTQPELWRELLPNLLPKSDIRSEDPLHAQRRAALPIKEQIAEFQARTGKSRRTFFNYRKKLGLVRTYRKRKRDAEVEPAPVESGETS